MHSLRYFGDFRSKTGKLVRCEIFKQEDGVAFTPERVTFPAGKPLVIEWKSVDKLEPVISSIATLVLVSETDRQFIDMYSIAVGAYRLDVYVDGALYWSGTLDPELYEEPFSYAQDYEVTMTFSDMAILDRLDCAMEGSMTIAGLIDLCLLSTGISYEGVDKYISTRKVGSSETLELDQLKILTSNFYDEDGEPLTLRDALAAVLKPFALRIVQRSGRVFVYDLNALYTLLERRQVEWSGEDANLSTDTVFNKVVLTYSPYASSELVTGKVDYETAASDHLSGCLFKTDYDIRNTTDSFQIVNGSQGKGLTLANGAQFYRIEPLAGANEEAGVLWCYYAGQKSRINPPASQPVLVGLPPIWVYNMNGSVHSQTIITAPKCYLGKNNYSSRYTYSPYKLKINLQLLFDVRYNPFEDASSMNEKELFKTMSDWCNFAYVPFLLTLRNEDGTAISHYENYKIMESDSYIHSAANSGWVAGEGALGCAFLAYYNHDNRKSATGLGGWANNKRCIGYFRDSLPGSWKDAEDGEYIELPDTCGWLELKIGSGVHQFDYKREVKDIYQYVRWVAYKEPTITLIKNGATLQSKDIRDTAFIDPAAREKMEIETMLGTMPDYYPSAKGVVFDNDMVPQGRFTRAGKTDRLERLLIGTAYSQYRGRHSVLSGSAYIVDSFALLTDRSQPGVYLVTGDVQDLMEGETEITMTEIEPDNYTGIEYS